MDGWGAVAPILFPTVAIFSGLAVGSFLNVVIMRGSAGRSLGGRSCCDACGKMLAVCELIPLVSFVMQKGRCRSCGAALSWQYPIVEAATAFVFFAIAVWMVVQVRSEGYTPGSLGVFYFALFPIAAALIVLVVSDIRFQILPDGATAVLFLAGLARSMLAGTLPYDAVSASIVAGFFGALWFFSRGRWMGFGDVKLAFAASFLIGFPASFAALLFSFWLGGLWGGALLLWRKKGLKSRIAFGPFIIAGAGLAALFWRQFFSLTGFWAILS